jgi:hypothetical protein
MDQMYFKAASDQYFADKNAFQVTLDELEADLDGQRITEDEYRTDKQVLEKGYAEAKATYFELHPRFEEMLSSSEKQDQRKKILDALRRAREDPDAPLDQDHVSDLFVMLEGVDQYEELIATMAHLGESNEAKRRRRFVKDTFIDWGEEYVRQNRTLGPFWTVVVGPYLRLPDYSEGLVDERRAGT